VAEQEEPGAEQPGQEQEPFVQALVPDPNRPPDVAVLRGFPGAGPDGETDRLYLDEKLNRWVEFPKTVALHREQLTEGGVIVWLRHDAVVRYTRTDLVPANQFLKGPIAAAYLTRAMEAAPLGFADPGAVYAGTRYCSGNIYCITREVRCIVTTIFGCASGPLEYLCGPGDPLQ
jgi:hypothetical protein